ncbi:MAG: serine hydrolase domain-containing protein [Elusimicrobiota bacterium]
MRALLFALLFAPMSDANAAAHWLEELRVKHGLPALGAAVVDRGSVTVRISGYRKNGDQTPAAKTDQFHLGSNTKAMTATLLALFVQRGRLRWDSTLGELFPDLDMDAAYKKVTVEMLTAQRSGITGDVVNFDGGRLWAKLWEENLDPRAGRELLTEAVLSAPPAYPPGSRFEYSNANYMIAGAVLERISDEPWEQLIRRELFAPLRMDCGFGAAGNAAAKAPDQPWGHVKTARGWEARAPGLHADNPPSLGPAGTVHCSMAGWARFLKFQMDGYNRRPTPILKPDSFIQLQAAVPGQEYTAGGWIRISRGWAGPAGVALNHAGSNTMNYAVAWLAPERDLAVLAVSNAAGDEAARAADEAVAALIQEASAPRPPQ